MQSSPAKRKDQTMETEIDQPPTTQNDKKRKTKKAERRRRQTANKFKLDPSTAHGSLALTADNATATYVREDQAYPSHPARFSFWQQVLCTGPGLAGGRWSWEVEVTGWVSVAVAYDSIARGAVDGGLLGYNARSWSLVYSEAGGGSGTRYTACHMKTMTEHRPPTGGRHCCSPSSPPPPGVIGVYLDWDEGDLTFYRGSVGSEDFAVLHSFSTTFDAPLYPAFRLGWYGSSVSLLRLTKM